VKARVRPVKFCDSACAEFSAEHGNLCRIGTIDQILREYNSLALKL